MTKQKKPAQMRSEPLRLKQLIACQWNGHSGLNYSLVGLDEDGRAYRFSVDLQVWVPYSMRALED